LAAASGLWAEGGQQDLSASANLSPSASVALPAAPAPWKDSGFEYCFGVSALSLFNASPLAFTPFELGWRFSNGLHLRTAVDVFYYEGLDFDPDPKAVDKGPRKYSYEMRDIRASLLYSVPLPGRLKPMAGMTVELLGGTRKLTGLGIVNPGVVDAWGFVGTGAVLGGEFRMSENWSAELLGRYTFSFGAVGSVTSLGLDLAYLF
jgi:hypothetical protein